MQKQRRNPEMWKRRNDHCWAIAHGYLNLVSSTWVIILFCLSLICPTRESGNRTNKGGDILVGPKVKWVMRRG